MILRIIGLNTRNRPAAIVLGTAALGLGVVLLLFGIALLIGVAAIGTVIGAGVLLARAISGRGLGLRGGDQHGELDPALEVFAEHPAARPLPRQRPAGHDPEEPRAHEPG